jgi:hypothetical protein
MHSTSIKIAIKADDQGHFLLGSKCNLVTIYVAHSSLVATPIFYVSACTDGKNAHVNDDDDVMHCTSAPSYA